MYAMILMCDTDDFQKSQKLSFLERSQNPPYVNCQIVCVFSSTQLDHLVYSYIV